MMFRHKSKYYHPAWQIALWKARVLRTTSRRSRKRTRWTRSCHELRKSIRLTKWSKRRLVTSQMLMTFIEDQIKRSCHQRKYALSNISKLKIFIQGMSPTLRESAKTKLCLPSYTGNNRAQIVIFLKKFGSVKQKLKVLYVVTLERLSVWRNSSLTSISLIKKR